MFYVSSLMKYFSTRLRRDLYVITLYRVSMNPEYYKDKKDTTYILTRSESYRKFSRLYEFYYLETQCGIKHTF